MSPSAFELGQLMAKLDRSDIFPSRAGFRPARYGLDLLYALLHFDRDGGHSRRCRCFYLGIQPIFTGLNFIVTIHTMRPPA